MGFSSRIVFLGLILLAASEISANRGKGHALVKPKQRPNHLPCVCRVDIQRKQFSVIQAFLCQ